MKAVVYHEYGSPGVLEMQEIDKPVIKDDEVLVRVRATAVNAADLDLLRGTFLVRLAGPLKPKYKILGSDIAGRVEAVGTKVEQFLPGDEVFGDLTDCGFGAFAEYVGVPESALALKPGDLSFEQAAAVPSAVFIAIQGLRYKSQIQSGHKVLINGAGGGAGTFAVQIAKSLGAEVTAVDSALKLDMLRSIGADHVIDYAQEDFTKNGQRFDLILDAVARRSIFEYKRSLSPKGVYVMAGGSLAAALQAVFLGPLVSMIGSKKLGLVMVRPNQQDLAAIKELLEAGQLVPVVDRAYPLGKVAEALRYLEEGHAKGKLVITV